jgi:hypothetical protein
MMTAPKSKAAQQPTTTSSTKEDSVTLLDTSKLSYADKVRLIAEMQQEVAAAKVKQIESLAEEFNKALHENGFTLSDALPSLYPELMRYAAGRNPVVKRAARSTTSASVHKNAPWTDGTTYANPTNTAETWTGGSKGAKPKWLRAIIDGMDDEQQKAKFAELAK